MIDDSLLLLAEKNKNSLIIMQDWGPSDIFGQMEISADGPNNRIMSINFLFACR